MFNPPSSYQNSGSFEEHVKRMTGHMQENQVDNQILEILQQAFEKELGRENIVRSRPERKRLFQEAAKAILTDVLGKIGGVK